MMQKLKKPISIVLSIMMVLSLFTIVPITASAETTGTVYDSGSVEVKDLQAGDYIVAGVGEVTDPSWTYDLVLKGGTYYCGADVCTNDLLAEGSDSYEILSENGRIYFENWGDTINYYPYVDGEEANAFYVESADHDAKTITLAGANYSAEEPATEEPTTAEPTTVEPTTEPAPEPTTAEPSTEATTVAPGETLTYNLNDENANIHWDDNCSTEGHWSMYAETDDINFLLGSLNTPQAAGTYAWKDLDRTSCEIFIFEGENLKWYYFTDGSCTVAVDGNTVTINGTFTCEDGNTYVLNITTTQPEPTTEPAPVDHTYTVAGSSAAMFGTTWDATNIANDMVKGDDGVYSITYADVQPENAIQLKVVEDHAWDHAWGDKETGDNYTFNVVEACDVTVTFDPATETVNVTGDGVTQDTELDVYSVIAVGNGEDTYLNGANWDPCDPANAMTEVADGVWEMTMEDIYAFDNYNIKFAVNSVDAEGNPTSNPWAHNFGSEVEQLYPTGEELDAVYNGKNCIFEVEEDGSTVKFQLDLRNFDFKTKSGAKMTITVTAPQPAAKIGDINGDGTVDILDATIAQKAAAGKTQLTPEQDYVGDVNNDGVCDILDATMIQKYAAGKITEFPKKA